MIPRAVQLKSGIKPFTTAGTVDTAYPKSHVKSAQPITTFVKSAQTGKRTFYKKKVVYNQKWVPKTKIAKPAVATARPKVTTVGSVNKNRVKLGNAVKALAR